MWRHARHGVVMLVDEVEHTGGDEATTVQKPMRTISPG
jgi:hypothetical protein